MIHETTSIVVKLDTSGRITFANSCAMDFFGLSPADISGGCAASSLLQDQALWKKDLSIALSDLIANPGSYWSSTLSMKRGGEGIALVTWNSVGIPGPDGDVVEILCIGTDISRLGRIQGEYRKMEERYHSLVETTSDWIWEVDLDGAIFYNSPSVFGITGYTPQELSGKDLVAVLAREGSEGRLASLIDKVKLTGTPFERTEVSVKHKAGYELVIELTGLPIIDDNGKIVGVRGINRDMTNEKRAEQALRESEEKYRNFIENAPMGMMISDTLGNITYGNRKLAEITGYKLEDWQNQSYAEMVHPDDLLTILENRTRAIETLETVPPYEIRIYIASGEMRWLRAIPHSVYEEDEFGARKVVYFQNFLEDITDSKIAQEEKERLEQQLRQSHKMEAIGTLAGGIAHDFNNVLYPIMGFTEMAMGDIPEDSQTFENLEEVLVATTRAKELVSQILTFSRQSEERQKPMLVQPVLDDVLGLLRASLPSSIRISKDIRRVGGVIMADEIQIHQVVLNLCTNAYQAMGSEGGVLGIELDQCVITGSEQDLAPDVAPGNYMRLVISDDGIGMTRETMERIFEPYFTTKPVGEGTGMGLAVAHGIITKHGGAIQVESQPGEGTRFVVYFPLVDTTPKETQAKPKTPIPQGKEHVLLVDDEQQILDMSSQVLERLGYVVKTVNSGNGALDYFCANHYGIDLLVTDMTMPDMTGAALTKKILATRADLPVIIVSGFTEGFTEKDARDVGAARLINKPVNMRSFAETVREVLDESGK